jgi:ribose transport system ATP-binding protein
MPDEPDAASSPGGGADAAASGLVVDRISKTFPGQRALINFSMGVEPGTVIALAGQNGSGKSTMIRILAGAESPDPGGSVTVGGVQLHLGRPHESFKAGMRFVHQQVGVIGALSATENMALTTGFVRRRVIGIDWARQRARTRSLLAELGIEFDIDAPMRECSAVERSSLAIARALDVSAGPICYLILDEPTATLSPIEVDRLFDLVRSVRDRGVGILYVSHRMDDVRALADKVTIIRDGRLIGTYGINDVTNSDIAYLMVGNNPPGGGDDATIKRRIQVDSSGKKKEGAFRIHNLQTRLLRDFSMTANQGEVVGVGGLTGSGREDVAAGCVGALASATCEISIGERKLSRPTPRTATAMGVVLALGARLPGSAADQLSIAENLTLPSLRRYQSYGWINAAAEMREADRWRFQLDIRSWAAGQPLRDLSGGNRQKVVLAKWLNVAPAVLLLEEPTAGVDVGAKAEIYRLIRRLREDGIIVVVCSSDITDLVAVCTRVLVLHGGRLAHELSHPRITEATVLEAVLAS